MIATRMLTRLSHCECSCDRCTSRRPPGFICPLYAVMCYVHTAWSSLVSLQELKFGIGDGKLNYYLYNWRVRREMAPQQVGLVLL